MYLDAELVVLGPDLVHFEFGALAVGRTHLKDLMGTSIVVSFRGHDLDYVALDSPDYYAEVWRYADGVHCLGEFLWTRAQERGCPSHKLKALIPPAVDVGGAPPPSKSPPARWGTPERPLRILSVARLYWTKGYEFALQAVRRVRDAGVNLEYKIAGSGPYAEAIMFCSHQLGLSSCVEFLGDVRPEEVRRLMRWADVYMHASVEEGFSNAVLEAQCAGLPVVCTDAGGLPENVDDQVTGFVAPRRDPTALAEKLMVIVRNPELAKRMGRTGRQRVEAHFGVDQQIERFVAFYQRVMQRSRANRRAHAVARQ